MCHPELPVEKAVTALPFPVRCVRELLDASLLPSDAIALEAGCSVGASSFELARYCSFVEAGDFSNSFIAAAKVLQSEGEIVAQRILEGEITTRFVATVSSGIDRNRVKFSLQDAMNLPEGIGPFDVLLAANLICRLPDPDAFLHRVASLVKPGGQLLLTTPFTWLEICASRPLDRRDRSGAKESAGTGSAAFRRVPIASPPRSAIPDQGA